MHVVSPEQLSEMVDELLTSFKKHPPKFIVDTHNRHFPYDGRPPLELWPMMQYQILKKYGIAKTEPDKAYADWLGQSVDSDEAERYWAMEPFREFVMENYKIAKVFGAHVIFQLKN